ncbi:hypothetical protein ACPWSR_10155 [Alloiococcus sp. CFN-8]|uniref:DUF7922 domain-containing protein n=1 Tax=Alloiococcus sp. CFN-8 TaxID=3416081 RepID=UPI003CE8DDB3
MAHSRLYRSFLILQEAEKGYSIASDKPISAYTKIEGKNDSCRISFYAQNLKKDNYHMLLICGKKGVNKNISLGPLNINEQGRAEVSGDYVINNIAGTGIPMNSISGAAIIILRDDKIKAVMKGYMNGEKEPMEWTDFPLMNACKATEESSSPEPEAVQQVMITQPSEAPAPSEPAAPSMEEQSPASEIIIPQEEQRAAAEAEDIPQKEEPASSSEVIIVQEAAEDEGRALLNADEAKEESDEGTNRRVDIISSKSGNDISIEELEALKAFIKEQELRLGIAPKEEKEENILTENLLETLEAKEARNGVFDNVSPELKKDIEELNSIDIKGFKRDQEENEFDSYEKSIEENKLKLMENNYDELNKKFNLRGSVGEFFLELAKDFEPLDLEDSEIKYCKWYRVPVESVDELCDISNYNKYTVAYYPMINYYPYIKNHKHFILGLKGDKKGSMKYLVYGIPGGKGKQEQPYGGKSGFVTWIPCDKNEDKGYWLMFYDFKNSVIVVPIRQEE